MSGWTDIFLGIIAFATLVMALIQVGAIVFAARLAGQVQQLAASVQQDIRPLIVRATAIAEEASRTATASGSRALAARW